jgi:hypothetical protein
MNVTSRLLLSGLSVAGVAVSLATPAHATLQIAITVGGTSFF